MAAEQGPNLVLGPILRHAHEDEAMIWVETDRPCSVTIGGTTSRTWCVEGHHYALVEVRGAGAGGAYEVDLDGIRVWPEPGSELPASTIAPPAADRDLRIVFGSCRVALPHVPPYVLDPSEHPEAQGIDALRTLALEVLRGEQPLPDHLLLLGDQVYADDLSPAMRRHRSERLASGEEQVPLDQLADFDDYARAYHEAWSEPAIRWLLSTVPTSMIFDDHEIHAQWKTSLARQKRLEARPWYERHITAGLMAYWIYQHLGNLDLAELAELELLAAVRGREADAGPLLREEMAKADRQASHSRWSFCRDLGRARLVVVDSRAGRELEPGARRMINDGEWEWIVERTEGEFEHLLLASSVPFFLTPGLHHVQSWNAAVCEGAWGGIAARVAERIREAAVMDHWASFGESFQRLCRLLREVASGAHGRPPRSIVMLSGDVHHCYLAEIGFPAGASTIPVWQAVCSAYRKELRPREKRAMRIGSSRAVSRLARGLARAARVSAPPLGWRLAERPSYENQAGLLRIGADGVELRVATPAGSDWREPRLSTVFEHRLS